MSVREWLIRAASRSIPAPYRDEVAGDLREQHARLGPLLLALCRSGRDARRQMPRRRAEDMRWSGLGADVRGAFRMHRARPLAALAIALILAIAIGLNTAVYSMVDAVLVRPLPFLEVNNVVFVWNTSSRMNRDTLAPARALDLRAKITSLESAALIGHMSMTVSGRAAAERWFGASVSSSFFDVLRTPPLLGRTFTTSEPDRDVVVLSHRLWVDQFGADAGAVGQRVVMNGRPRTVVGVMPSDFYWPSITPETVADNPPLFWTCAPFPDVPERMLPFDESITQNRTMGFLRMVARLRPDRTLEVAEAEAVRVASDLGREYPTSDGGKGVMLVPARAQLLGTVAQPLWFVLLASALVVLGACVNVGNLILVRQAGRHRELAVRSALGAGRARLVRQLMIEAAVLAVAGGIGGAALAIAGFKGLVAIAPDSVGRLDNASINGMVLVWTAVATALTALSLGALSALALWRDTSAEDLRASGTAERGRGFIRQALIAVEVALAVALMVGAALFGQSLLRLQRVDVGFDTSNLLTFDIMLVGQRAEYMAKQMEFYNGVLDRVRALPGVVSAAGAFTLPIGGDDFGASAFPEGRPLPGPGADRRIGFQIVGDQWFRTLGMRIRDGRDFLPSDTRTSTNVVIINQALADIEWPGQRPVGLRLKYAREADAPWLTIVGVVSNIHHMGPGEPPRPEIYLPYSQMSQAMMAVAVRTQGDPMALVPAVRAAAAQVDSTQPISGVNTMEAHLTRSYGRARFLTTLTLLFGVVTCLLTVVGVYAVTSFAVTQRTREFGVRAALGASPGRLGREVLISSLMPVWFGAAAGIGLAMWTARMVGALLFGVAPLDPVSYAAATGILVITAGLASFVPARRAAVLDPVKALRDG
jgi:putative ABC transport system permease protein